MGESWGSTLKRVLKGPIGRAEPRMYHWLPYLISGPVALRYCCLIPVPRSECLALVGWEVSMPGSPSACSKAWVTLRGLSFPFPAMFPQGLGNACSLQSPWHREEESPWRWHCLVVYPGPPCTRWVGAHLGEPCWAPKSGVGMRIAASPPGQWGWAWQVAGLVVQGHPSPSDMLLAILPIHCL